MCDFDIAPNRVGPLAKFPPCFVEPKTNVPLAIRQLIHWRRFVIQFISSVSSATASSNLEKDLFFLRKITRNYDQSMKIFQD